MARFISSKFGMKKEGEGGYSRSSSSVPRFSRCFLRMFQNGPFINLEPPVLSASHRFSLRTARAKRGDLGKIFPGLFLAKGEGREWTEARVKELKGASKRRRATRQWSHECARRESKSEAAPASRSIMRRVTHATLLHREPCYASTGQGGPEDLWGDFAGNREMRGIAAVFISAAFPRFITAAAAAEQLPKQLASTRHENIKM